MSGKTILIIDTDREMIQQMISTLESADYLVFSALNKNDSINVARKVNPSLIFINIGMAGASGLDISKTIHDDEALRDIPIVILTPHGGRVESRYTSIYGIVDFLKTSFSREELIRKTEDILSGSALPDDREQENIPEHPHEEVIPEEKVTAHIPEDDTAVQFEEVLTETTQTEEKPPDKAPAQMGKEDAQASPDAVPDTDDWSGMKPAEQEQEKEPEKTEPSADVQAEEDIRTYAMHGDERESAAFRGIAEPKSKIKMYLPVILVAIVMLGAAGFFLFKDDLQMQKPLSPIAEKPSMPSEKPGAEIQLPVSPAPPVQTTPVPQPSMVKPQVPVEKKSKETPQHVGKTHTQKTETIRPASRPVSTPKPAVAESPQKAGYAVQIGVFRNKQNALSVMKAFQAKGYAPRIHESRTKNNGVAFRVLIGSFPDRKEAVTMAERVRTKEKTETLVYHQPPSGQ